eukprot:1856417-Lingulodinium_polyedra.AAC.1
MGQGQRIQPLAEAGADAGTTRVGPSHRRRPRQLRPATVSSILAMRPLAPLASTRTVSTTAILRVNKTHYWGRC